MKICLFTETALPKIGGQELVVDALAREFVEQGHDVVVLAQYPRRPLVTHDRLLPYRVVRHQRFVSTWRLLDWYRYVLLKLHRKFPFEVLHCHSVHPCGYLGAVCRDRSEFALVLTSHGGDIRQANVRLQKPGALARYTLTLKRADAVVSISRFTTEALRSLEPSANIVEIPNGVDLRAFENSVARPSEIDSRIRPDEYVLFLGRLHWRKGVDVLLNAWATYQAGNPSNRMLVVAGDGGERDALADQARQLDVAASVCFVGPVMGAYKTWLLQNARGVCLPSRQWEGLPLVALEAFGAGKPVIGTRLPGIEEVIVPGRTGWLVPPESPAELAAALQELLGDCAVLGSLSANARRDALERSWRSIAARHIELYRSIRSRSTAKAA